MIHLIWQVLFFLQAWTARHTTDFKRNGPTWLHVNVHLVVHPLFETGTFCPVSVHHTVQRDAQPQELPQPLHMSRCMNLNCGIGAVVPSFTLHQLHTNPDLPQNENTFFPCTGDRMHKEVCPWHAYFNRVFSLLLSSGNSLRHLPSPLTVCISRPLTGFVLVAHPQRQKHSCHSALVKTDT